MRLDQLTFTRFIAAIAVVAFHFAKETSLYQNDLINFIFKNAYLAVSYFFVLSGFVMVIAYQNRKKVALVPFMKNRIARIIPLYLFAFIIFICLDKSIDYDKIDIFYFVFLIQTWVTEKALILNEPSWSLSVEFFFYAIFPFLINILYKKVSLPAVIILLVIFWAATQITNITVVRDLIEFPYYSKTDLNYHPLMHLNSFLIGNVTGLLFLKHKETIKFLGKSLITISILLILILSLKTNLVGFFNSGMIAPIMALFIISLSLNKSIYSRFLSNKILVFLGEISFGIYILQKPVWILLHKLELSSYLIKMGINSANILFSFKCLILIIISSITYKLIELPLQKFIKTYSYPLSQ